MSCHNLDRNRLITLIIGNAFWQTLFVIVSILEAILYHLVVIIYFFYHKQYTVSFLTTNFLSRWLKNVIPKIFLHGPLFNYLSLQWIRGPMRSITNLNGLYIHIHIFCFVGELKKRYRVQEIHVSIVARKEFLVQFFNGYFSRMRYWPQRWPIHLVLYIKLFAALSFHPYAEKIMLLVIKRIFQYP